MPSIVTKALPAPRTQAEADLVRALLDHPATQSTGDITVYPVPPASQALPPSNPPSSPVVDPWKDKTYPYMPGNAQPISKA